MGGGYSDFYLLQGLGLFFGVQNFEFRYFFMCRSFVNYFYGYANLSVYFGGGGMSFSIGIFWGVSVLKMFILFVRLLLVFDVLFAVFRVSWERAVILAFHLCCVRERSLFMAGGGLEEIKGGGSEIFLV